MHNTGLLIVHGKRSNFTGFSESNLWKKRRLSQEIHRNFLSKVCGTDLIRKIVAILWSFINVPNVNV